MRRMKAPRPKKNSLPARQEYLGFDRFAVTQDLDCHFVPWLPSAESIREIVEVLYRLTVPLDHNVAGLEAGLGCGRPGSHVGEFDAGNPLSEIRDRAEPGTVARTS